MRYPFGPIEDLMTNLMSGISGHLPRNLTLGSLLPIAVFVLLLQTAIPKSQDWPLLRILSELDPSWRVAATTLLIVALACLLYVFNVPLTRLYEGYPWQSSWLGRRRIQHYRNRLSEIRMRERFLDWLERTLSEDDEREAILGAWKNDLRRELFEDYPKSASVLPTQLGNVIRSFENYADRQYRMSATTMWPRLVAKIPSDYAEALDDAKTKFDFVLNCSFLSTVLALAILGHGLARPEPFVAARPFLWWLFNILGLLLISRFFYKSCIPRAAAWGTMVRSAFDLYRLNLLSDLGFRQEPATLEEERELWQASRYQMQFGDLPAYPQALRYLISEPKTYAYAANLKAESFEIARGVVRPKSGSAIEICVQVRNRSQGGRTAEGLHLVDSLPEGYDYLWGSARAESREVRLTGVDPYDFFLGELARDQAVNLSYVAVRRSI